jgi:tetratricopeptide (TPR) repeat protein
MSSPAVKTELQRGIALKQQGRARDAEALFRTLLTSHPDNPLVLTELGILASETGAAEEAAAYFSRAAALAPRDSTVLNNLGAALTTTADYEAAIDALERAVALTPAFEHGWHSLARTLIVAGEPERALEVAARLQARNRNHIGARMNLIRSLSQLGRFEEAEAEALEMVAQWPSAAAGYITLAPLRRFAAGDPLIDAAQRVADGGAMAAHETGDLLFALGKMYDDAGDVDRAFATFGAANARNAGRYDRRAWEQQTRDVMEAYSRARISARRAHGHPSAAPVLVVGMPRSGTTLVESLLAANPSVASVGESVLLPNVGGSLSMFTPRDADLNTTIRSLNAEAAEILGHRYVRALKRQVGDASKTRIVDKMPHNFLNLGLAALIVPEARIIHVRRAPAATALSVWMQNFNGHHGYAARFDDIAHHYALYRKLMAHWRDALGERILDVSYEDVVNNPALETERMLDFIGLPSGGLELNRDRALKVVATASVWQVRQPIHRNSIDRGSAYARHLEPLKAALAEFGVDDCGAARETESA